MQYLIRVTATPRSGNGERTVSVEATNWLSALGIGLDRLGIVGGLDRLACEVLPNGRVVGRDARSGQGFVVEPELMQDDDTEESAFALESLEDEEETHRTHSGSGHPEDEALTRALLSTIASAKGEQEAWEHALDVAQELIPAEAASGMRLQTGGLQVIAARGPRGPALVGAVLPLDRGVAAFSATRGAGLIIQEARRDPRFNSEADRVTGFRTDALLCAAVRKHEQPAGVIQLLNPPVGSTFASGDLRLLSEIAAVLGRRLSASS